MLIHLTKMLVRINFFEFVFVVAFYFGQVFSQFSETDDGISDQDDGHSIESQQLDEAFPPSFNESISPFSLPGNDEEFEEYVPDTIPFNSNQFSAGQVDGGSNSGDIEPAVIGGKTVWPPHKYPFIVSLQEKNGKHLCGGSLISRHHVLTVAHCLFNKNGQIKSGNIRIGVGLHNVSARATPEHYFNVKHVQVHKDYVGNKTQIVYDIALLTLAKPVSAVGNLKGKVGTIELPISAHNDPKPGSNVIGIGWGVTNPVGERKSTALLQGSNFEVLTQKTCSQKMKEKMPDSKICIDSSSKGACQGDSGGPLFRRSSNGRFLQDGVISYGRKGCVRKNTAGVFTSLILLAVDQKCNGSEIKEEIRFTIQYQDENFGKVIHYTTDSYTS